MLSNHSYRSRSRQSTASTTPDIDSLHSWSRSMVPRNGGGSATTVTSVWSDADDGATVLPSSEEGKWGRDQVDMGRDVDEYGGNDGGVIRRGSTPGGERPLIELDSDYESYPTRRFQPQPQCEAGPSSPPLPPARATGPKPSEELRRLLRQMEDEVKLSTPADPIVSPIKRPTSLPSASQHVLRSPPVHTSQRRANWREGRRIGVYPPQREAGDSSPERNRSGNVEDEEEESPPTPPVRITNPYLYSARKASDPNSSSKHRISSRAAVLHNSTSRTPPPASPSPRHSPSPLETFIATHPVPSDPSSSRSPQAQLAGSKKGKERADPNSPLTQQSQSDLPRKFTPSRNYTRRHSSSTSDDAQRTLHRPVPIQPANGTSRPERPRRTPRRYSVELAPDNSEIFARGLEGEDGVGVDLDEDEEGLGKPWVSEAGSGSGEECGGDEGEAGAYDERDMRGYADHDPTSRQTQSGRYTPAPATSPHISNSPKSPNRSKDDSSRLSRLLNVERNHRRETSADVSLPYLSDPEDGVAGEGVGADASLSERRAGLFRPGSRAGGREGMSPGIEKERSPPPPIHQQSSSRLSVSPRQATRLDRSHPPSHPDTSQNRSSDSSLLHPEYHSFPSPPVRIGMTLTPPGPTPHATAEPTTPTPPRHANAAAAATPHPPGWLPRLTPAPAPPARAVRFSPLRQTDKDWSLSQATTSSVGEVSVHRLKCSPKRSLGGSPLKPTTATSNSPESDKAIDHIDPDTSFTGRIARFLLPPSTTLRDASADLERARRLSEVAHARVEESKRAWSEALGELGRQAGEAGKKGASWGTWGSWILVEVLLVWCVFRLTIDYTSSLNPHSNTFQTLNLNPHALSIRIPGALSAFVIPRESANFFDVVERYEVWKRVQGVMTLAAQGLGGHVGKSDADGSLGGMRMVGGVPS